MHHQAPRARRFLDLHVPGEPLLMPNPWDAGSARVLARLGFQALATTSGGHAATLGRFDGSVSRDEALAHAAAIADAVDLPVSCDFENGFADDPQGVAESVRLAAGTGVAGLSIEDWSGDGIYEIGLAAERVGAAVEAAPGLAITARSENYLRGNPDFDDTLMRLTAYQEAGASVAYAPWMVAADEIRRLVTELEVPVNVLVRPDGPKIAKLAELGVARVSVGSAFQLVALAALESAAEELREEGTYGWFDQAVRGAVLRDEALS